MDGALSSRRRAVPASIRLVAAGVVLAWGAALASQLGGPTVTGTLSNVGLATMALTAGAGCLRASRQRTGRSRRGWLLLSLSALSWGGGQVIWAVHESVLGREVPFPSLADVGYLGAVPLAAAAVLSFPVGRTTVAGRIRTVVDGLLIASSLLVISWVSVLGPVFRSADGSVLSQVISVAYPVGDVVVVTMALLVLLRQRRLGSAGFPPIALVCWALVAIGVADSGFTYLTLTESYSSGSFIDIFWFAGYLLLCVASFRREPVLAVDEPGDDDRDLSLLLLPYTAVVAAVAASVLQVVLLGSADVFVSWSRSFIMGSLVARQVLALLQNRSLTRHLEARVVQRTEELAISQQRFEALVQHSSDVVTVVDAAGVVTYQSESASAVLGYDPGDLVGRRITELLPGESAALLQETLATVALHPYRSTMLEMSVHHVDGRLCTVETTVTNLLANEAVRGLVLNTRDVSERRRLEDQLKHQAFHDSLTALANRALFRDRIDRALHHAGDRDPSVAVLFLDLDGFKEVNDSLGHAAGDLLLVQVAERLRRSARSTDTVARLGGDEFAVLLEDAHTEDVAVAVARRMRAALQAPFLVEGRAITVRGSFGIASAGVEASSSDQLLRNADLAMYRAKAVRDGGYACYDPVMHADLVDRLELEADLCRAVELDQLELHFQPTVSLASREALGVEALVRWQHPRHGLLQPDRFIPLAEETGAIGEIGRWVLFQACDQAARWRQRFEHLGDLRMSVNISGRQLQQGDLVGEVSLALQRSGLPPRCLVLEITETVLMEDSEHNQRVLASIKALGVQLAIDDFGTGYSSLSYLQQFPVDILKIDRSFIRNLAGGDDEAELVRTILDLAQALHLTTIAEGIEEDGQLDVLRAIGCEHGQGYLIAAPAPAAEVERLLGGAARSPDPGTE